MKLALNDESIVSIVAATAGWYEIQPVTNDDDNISDLYLNPIISWSIDNDRSVEATTLEMDGTDDRPILAPDGWVRSTMVGCYWKTFKEFHDHVIGKPSSRWHDLIRKNI